MGTLHLSGRFPQLCGYKRPHVIRLVLFSKGSTRETVFKSSRLQCAFSLDMCGRNKKFADRNEPGYVWRGPQCCCLHSSLSLQSPGQTRKHCCGNIVFPINVFPFPDLRKHCCRNKLCFPRRKNVFQQNEKHFCCGNNVS